MLIVVSVLSGVLYGIALAFIAAYEDESCTSVLVAFVFGFMLGAIFGWGYGSLLA